MKPLLELKHVSYAYHSKNGETPALTDISFQVQRGEFIAVVGPSGCGNPMVELWKQKQEFWYLVSKYSKECMITEGL